MTQLLFILWIVSLPLVVWKTGYEGPKVLSFLLGTTALLIFWIRRILVNLKDIEFDKADYAYFLWLTILLLASLFGVHPLESIIGGSYRHQGVIFFLGLWLIGKTISILDKKRKKFLFKAVAVTVIIECLILGFQLVTGKTYFGKPLGTIGEANAIAGFLALGSYFVLESFPKLMVLLPILGIAAEQSRSGLLALAPLVVRFWRKALVPISLIILSVILYLTTFKPNDFFENRNMIWKVGISQVLKKPILGYGAESGEIVFTNAYRKLGFPLEGIIIDRAHNLFLDITMWSGVVGLTAFLFWLYQSYFKLKDLSQKLALLSFLVYAFLQPLSVVHWVIFILLISK